MIAGIDYQGNIEAFLDKDEIEKLPNGVLEGILIQTDRPKRQGRICISINEARKTENGFGIGLNNERYWGIEDNFELKLFIGTRYYEQLKKTGTVKEKQLMLIASKIIIYDRSRVSSSNIIKIKGLEFYRDNKDGLPEGFR